MEARYQLRQCPVRVRPEGRRPILSVGAVWPKLTSGRDRHVPPEEVQVIRDSLLERFADVDVEVAERVNLDLAEGCLLGVPDGRLGRRDRVGFADREEDRRLDLFG